MADDKYYHFGNDILFATLLERDKQQLFSRKDWVALADNNFFKLFSNETNNFKKEVDAYYQIAKGSLDLPFCLSTIAHNIGIKLINSYGSQEQKTRFLSKMENGSMLAAITNSERNSGTDVMSLQSSVKVNHENEVEQVSFHKIGSNIGDADLIFISAYKHQANLKKNINIFLIEKHQAQQISHTEDLFGFKTGLTGEALSHKNISLDLTQQLGSDKSGLLILNDCFNLERLYIAAMVAGALDRILHFVLSHVESKVTFEKKLSENQYIQDKIINIYSIKIKLTSILSEITANVKRVRDLKKYSKELAVLKIIVADEAFSAAISFFEVLGYRSYTQRHIAHKLIKDLLAFKFLGGSKEQQKILLFKDIQKKYL